MRNKILYIVALIFVLSACDKNECGNSVSPITYIGTNSITRVEIYPNSPVIIANGKAPLSFYFRAYYKINDSTEVPMLQDRIDLSKLKIHSSDNKVFNLGQTYTTTSTDKDSIFFTCEYNNLKSKKVGVAVEKDEKLDFPLLRVPVVFDCLYSDENPDIYKSVTKELLNSILDRVNKVFNNKFQPAANSASANIEFYLADIQHYKVSKDDNTYWAFPKFLKKTLDGVDYKNQLHIWLWENVQGDLTENSAVPTYIYEDKDFIRGLDLKPIAKIEDAQDLGINDVSIFYTYADLYSLPDRTTTQPLETSLGYFYGLLATGDYKNNPVDLDFCPDTFSYLLKDASLLKRTQTEAGQSPIFYKSYNIMDQYSACTSISRDQAKRIRQVIASCPFRQQGLKK